MNQGEKVGSKWGARGEYPAGAEKAGAVFLIAFLAGVGLYPWVVSAIALQRYRHVLGHGKRMLTLYAAWFLLCVPIIGLFMVAMGGVSQAVVESVTTRGALYQAAAAASLPVFLLTHLFILPWVGGSHWVLNRWVFKTGA